MDHLFAIFVKNDETCKFPRGNLSEIRMKRRVLLLFRTHGPVTERTRLRRETGADAIQLPAVRGIFPGITFLFDLSQGFFGRTVQLELKDIDIVGRFQHTVYTTLALHLFHINRINAHQT